jgi:hypothetical protein
MAFTADDRLALVTVKIKRAQKHLYDLETEIVEGGIKYLYAAAIDFESNAKAGDPILNFPHLSMYTVLPFDVLPAAGDVIHNLRSALDHLANQLVLANGSQPSLRTEFPIAKDFRTYKTEKRAKVKGMSKRAKAAIDALKPYKGGNDALWRLHDLDNIDKHRSLFTLFSNCLFAADWLPSEYPYMLKTDSPHFSGIVGDDTESGIVADDTENDVKLVVDKATSDLQITDSGPLLPTLHQMVDLVNNLVLAFKPLLG